MTTYVIRNGELVEKTYATPLRLAPGVVSDYGAYQSPVTGKMIEGRRAHREDLARSNCRVIEKGEHRAVYKNPTFALKRGLPLDGQKP